MTQFITRAELTPKSPLEQRYDKYLKQVQTLKVEIERLLDADLKLKRKLNLQIDLVQPEQPGTMADMARVFGSLFASKDANQSGLEINFPHLKITFPSRESYDEHRDEFRALKQGVLAGKGFEVVPYPDEAAIRIIRYEDVNDDGIDPRSRE